MSTQKQTKRSRMKRAAHAFGRTVQHYSLKVLSVFLSLLLIYQCFMTDGVSYALAEALNSNTATELSLDQENLSDDAVSDSGQEESAVTSSQEETAGSEETSLNLAMPLLLIQLTIKPPLLPTPQHPNKQIIRTNNKTPLPTMTSLIPLKQSKK